MNPGLSFLIIFALLPCIVIGQDPGNEEEDPFKRDPIFTKPLDQIFQRSTGELPDDTSRAFDEETVKYYVRSVNEDGIDFGGSLESGPYNSNPLFSQYPNLPMIHFNRVNGLFLGLRSERMQWHNYNNFLSVPGIRPHGLIGFGTATGRWEYALGLEKLLGRNEHFMIGAEFHRATATEDFWRVGLIESAFTSLFASYDYPDYFQMEGFGAYGAVRTRRFLEAAISYNVDTFSSLDLQTRYSFFGYQRTYRPNPGIDPSMDEAKIQRIALGATFNPRKIILARNFTFTASAKVELADNPGFDNDFSYNRYTSELKFYFNFEPGSVLKWRVKGGAITGEAPHFKQFHLGGIGSLRATPYKAFSGNQTFLSNLEVHFGRITGRPENWINFDSFHITLFLDSGWASFNESLKNDPNPFMSRRRIQLKDLKHDAGIGAGSGLLRLELAWPVDNFERSPAVWIRFNPTF